MENQTQNLKQIEQNKKGLSNQQQQQLEQQYQEDVLTNINRQFQDDEQIENLEEKNDDWKQKFNKQVDIEKILGLNLKSLNKDIKLSSKSTQILPVQIEILTQDPLQQSQLELVKEIKRPGVDLLFILDKSGSMKGEKIKLLKSTLIQILQYLGDTDRIGLVQFDSSAERVLPFTVISEINKGKILRAIDGIQASGGTEIESGVELGIKMLQDRRYKNTVSSIFLLSDGQDREADKKIKNRFEKIFKEETFSINCFGYGQDHDSEVMNNISIFGDGNFYFVQELSQVDEMFVDALGGLFSVVAQNLRMEVKVTDSKFLKGVKISKTYGEMWRTDELAQIHYIDFKQLIGGIKKEVFFEVLIPQFSDKIRDEDRNHSLIQCSLKGELIDESKQQFQKSVELPVCIYNEDEVIVPEINEDVEVSLIRVQGAQVLLEAIQKADSGKLQEGIQMMKNFSNRIQSLDSQKQSQLQNINKDIQQCLKFTEDQQSYEQNARHMMRGCQRGHMEQRSQVNNYQNNQYQNKMQTYMIQQQRIYKQ